MENNKITNCDINSDNIKRADNIWGPAEYLLKGKIKGKNPNKHNRITELTLPLSISKQPKIITMYIDILYVN